MTRIETIHKIRALIAVAEHFRYAFYMPPSLTINECIKEHVDDSMPFFSWVDGDSAYENTPDIVGTVPYFSWLDGNTKFTACYIVKCKENHIFAKGYYTRDGKKTNLTAIKNSLKRLEQEQDEKEND